MPLPKTKFRPPTLRRPIVPRPRLTRTFTDRRPLTIVSAPAGSGKTTLALEWLTLGKTNTAWLSIDPDDNDPIRFLNGFISALQSAGLKLHPPSGQRNVKTIITEIINQLDDDHPITLVLDDYHLISETAIHNAVEYLLDHIPAALQLAIVTRTTPPLPLSRLRARGQLREFHLEDLRFTAEETGQFLNHIMGLNLPTEQVQSLVEHTQGWVAGLQMAGLSIQSNSAPSYRNESERRFLAEYFLNEVFDHQPREVQLFLLNSSIPEKFTAAQCKSFFTGNAGKMLAYLEKANLFISVVGDWHQYHPLFRDFLLAKLTATHPERVTVLHKKTLYWLNKNNLHADAIPHAFAISDEFAAAGLIARLAPEALKHGELLTLRRWLERLPESVIWENPRLCVTQIWLLLDSGLQKDAQTYIDRLGNHLEKNLQSEFLILRALLAAMTHQPELAMKYVKMAQRTREAKDLFMQTYVAFGLGAAQKMASLFFEAEQSFRTSLALAESEGNSFIALSSYSNLIDVLYLQARLNIAEAACRDALKAFGETIPEAGDWYFTLARIAHQRSRLKSARDYANRSIDRCADSGQTMIQSRSLLQRAQTQHALGDQDRAQADLDSADMLARGLQDNNFLRISLRQRVLLSVRAGNPGLARKWFTVLESYGAAPYAYYLAYTKGRLLLAERTPQEAEAEFNAALRLLNDGGPVLIRIDTLLWNSVALLQLNRKTSAKNSLEDAIQLAQPEGVIRPFVEAWDEIAGVLSEFSQKKFLRAVETAYQNGDQEPDEARGGGINQALTRREREILQLLTVGMTNQEMARRLVIAEGTLKRHIANLYQKLGVHNRAQAIQHIEQAS